jgi:hypothetical protein
LDANRSASWVLTVGVCIRAYRRSLIMTVTVATLVLAAVLALSFKLLFAPLNIFAALSMTVNFVLKVLLGRTNALFAITLCIGQ